MKETDWEKHRAAIDAIPADEVVPPKIPTATYLQEANDLLIVTRESEIFESLRKVNVDVNTLEALEPAIVITRDRQSEWVVVRDRTKSELQVQREEEGRQLRSELIKSGRWHLRKDNQAQSVLDAIAEGEGVDDLIQDLDNLAKFVETHHPYFAKDQTWDWKTKVEDARTLASTIRAGKSSVVVDLTQEEAKEARDRAFTYLDGIVTEIREGGRWAFRDDAVRRSWFGSSYLRRARAAARTADQKSKDITTNSG